MPSIAEVAEMDEAIVRAPLRSELDQAALVGQIAFETAELEPWANSYRWIADNAGLDYAIVVEADRKIVASMIATPGAARFGDDIVPLCAVGGVATLPEYRARGYAGMMMRYSVKLLHDKGYHTSALWPFSFEYYRKFGWELGSEDRKYTIPSELAAQLAMPTGVRPAMEWDLPEISDMINRFACGYNGVSIRDNAWWACIKDPYEFKLNGVDDPKKTTGPWLHETDNVIDGYAFVTIAGEGDEAFFDLREVVADNPLARKALLSRFGAAGLKNVCFCAPVDDKFLQELENPRLVRTDVRAGFQFRVVNPPAAMKHRSTDMALRGQIGFDVTDPVLPDWTFDLSISEGRIRSADGRVPERLSMDIQTFSQLYSGYMRPSRAAELGRLQAISPKTIEFADRLFPKVIPFRSLVEIG